MKRHLLQTTALVAAGLCGLSAPAQAQIELTLGGFMKQWFGYASNDAEAFGGVDRIDFDQQSDTEVHFNFKMTADNGITFAGRIELEGDANDTEIDEEWVAVSGTFGEVRLGVDDNAANKMIVEPPNVGLPVGDIELWVVPPDTFTFIAIHEDEDAVSEDSNQIWYFTPRIQGLQLGASFIPDWDTQFADTVPAEGNDQNGVALGANYKGKFDDFSVGLGATYLTFLDPAAANADPSDITVSGSVGYAGFTLGAAWHTVDEFPGGQDGDAYEVGIEYGMGLWAVSFNFHHGEADATDDKTDFFLASGKHQLAKGADLVGNVVYAKYDNGGGRPDNDGVAIIGGIDISF